MLSGKTKKIFDILNEANDWVSTRKLITSIWGPESMDTDEQELKWRKNLAGHVSKIKHNLKSDYEIKKSSSLDAIKIKSKNINFDQVTCVSCKSDFIFKEILLNNACSSQVYCVKCLYTMMEDLGI